MFEIADKFIYLVLTIPFLVIWLILFLSRKDLRREILKISSITAVLGPLSEFFYFRDYWSPQSVFNFSILNFPIMLEDVLFGFVIGGIGSVIYEIILKKKQKNVRSKPNKIYIVILFLVVFLGCLFLKINSIFASSLGFISSGVYILFKRKDLFFNSLLSGLLTSFVMFLIYNFLFNFLFKNPNDLFETGWHLYNTNLGALFLGIPVTELVWAFSWGFLAGPLYEFIERKKNI